MTRRSTPQKILDDNAFPVRVKFVVPEEGLGLEIDAMNAWLHKQVGLGEFAWHGAGNVGLEDHCALYFRHPATAAAFAKAFPNFQIADGLGKPGYTSPHWPLRKLSEAPPEGDS